MKRSELKKMIKEELNTLKEDQIRKKWDEGSVHKLKYKIFDFLNGTLSGPIHDNIDFYEKNNDKVTAKKLKELFDKASEALTKLANYNG